LILILGKASDSFIIYPLSHDHKPDLEEEKARIIKNGGRVDRYNGIFFKLF
jgi:hypothetical protein